MNRIQAYCFLEVTILIMGYLLMMPVFASSSGKTLPSSGTIVYYPDSYIIYTDGTNYYAKNAATGIVDFSSTNANTLVAYAFGNLRNGGTVFFKAGTYTLNKMSFNFNNTIIDGEGQSSILQLASGESGNPHVHFLKVADCQNVTIQNICLDGNLQNNNNADLLPCGISIENSQHVTVQNCYVTNWRCFGISVSSKTSTSDVYDVNIVGNRVINCLWNGISFYSMVAGSQLHDCLAMNNYVEGSCDIALDTFAEPTATRSYGVQFINNIVNGYLTYPGYGSSGFPDASFGVRLEAGYGHLVQGNIIYDVSRGIADSLAAGGCGNNTILDNIIWINHTNSCAGIEVDDKNNIIRGNTIYGGFDSWTCGIEIAGNNNIVENNTIVNLGGAANFHGIDEHASYNPNGTTIRFNDVHLCAAKNRIVFASGTGQVVQGNIGYNPVGNIANPVSGSYLVDSGLGTIANNTVYTCSQSDKTIYVSGGAVSQIQVDGQTVSTTTGVSVFVPSGKAFKIVWSSAPEITVIGN